MDILVPNIAVSDHFPMQFTRVIGKSHINRKLHTAIQYPSYNKFNEELFLPDMATTMTHFNICQVNTDHNFETFTQTFIKVFDKHAQIKTKRVKRRTQLEWHNEVSSMLVSNGICITSPGTSTSKNIDETKLYS